MGDNLTFRRYADDDHTWERRGDNIFNEELEQIFYNH